MRPKVSILRSMNDAQRNEQARLRVQRAFVHFAQVAASSSPLYATVSEAVADEDNVCALAMEASQGQPAVNMVFGAVHDLLLRGVAHELAEFYPSVGGSQLPTGAGPVFAAFCREHFEQLAEIIRKRRVQTNEVGRSGVLLPAFALAQRMMGGRPLHLIEIGASAGLNLLLDRYGFRYEFADGRDEPIVLNEQSSVQVRTCAANVAREEFSRLVEGGIRIGGRVGVDIHPVDVRDEAEMRWLAALIWPDQLERIHLLRSAVQVTKREPPEVVAGDAMERVDGLVDRVDQGNVPVVYHTHAVYQMSRQWREAFGARIAAIGRQRDLVHVSVEWLGDDPGPRVWLKGWRDGAEAEVQLASCDHHGRWIHFEAGFAGSASLGSLW